MLNLKSQTLAPQFTLSDIETRILDYAKPNKNPGKKTLASYILKIVKPGRINC